VATPTRARLLTFLLIIFIFFFVATKSKPNQEQETHLVKNTSREEIFPANLGKKTDPSLKYSHVVAMGETLSLFRP
jgi:hypothetical protein